MGVTGQHTLRYVLLHAAVCTFELLQCHDVIDCFCLLSLLVILLTPG
jgi:hypothetical protein